MARIAFNPTSSSYPTPYLSTTSTTKVARATKWNATSSAAAAGLLEKPFGAPSYVQFGAIERLQEVSKVNSIHHSFANCDRSAVRDWPLLLSSVQVKWISQPEEVFNKSLVRRRKHIQQRRKKRSRRSLSLFYLIPLHGGIWHLCVDLQREFTHYLPDRSLLFCFLSRYPISNRRKLSFLNFSCGFDSQPIFSDIECPKGIERWIIRPKAVKLFRFFYLLFFTPNAEISLSIYL